MTRRFAIEDEMHAEWIGEFSSRPDAVEEIKRLATLPWNEHPNKAPCTIWSSCSRAYYILELDTDADPCEEIHREHILDVSASGVEWISPLES